MNIYKEQVLYCNKAGAYIVIPVFFISTLYIVDPVNAGNILAGPLNILKDSYKELLFSGQAGEIVNNFADVVKKSAGSVGLVMNAAVTGFFGTAVLKTTITATEVLSEILKAIKK